MCPRAVCLVVAALLLSGCGSDPASKTDGTDKADLKSSTTGYFTSEDTDALGRAVVAAQEVGAQARSRRSVQSCNAIEDYPAWRSCWHGLLDPYVTELTGLAGAFTALTTRELRPPCLTTLENAAERITTFAGTIDALLVGIDSSDRVVQVKSAKAYIKTLDTIRSGFAKPLRDLARDCYAP